MSQSKMSEKYLQHIRALILKGYVAGLIPRELAREKCNAITRTIEKMVEKEEGDANA